LRTFRRPAKPFSRLREKVPGGRMRARERSEALLLTFAFRAEERAEASSLPSPPSSGAARHLLPQAGEGLRIADFPGSALLRQTGEGLRIADFPEASHGPGPTPSRNRPLAATPNPTREKIPSPTALPAMTMSPAACRPRRKPFFPPTAPQHPLPPPTRPHDIPTPPDGKNAKPKGGTLLVCPEFPAMRVKGLKLPYLVT
jgi:hypothetical protein